MPMPELTQLISKDVAFSPYSIQWVPGSARICALGANGRGSGTIAVFEMQEKQLVLTSEVETTAPLRCGTFGAADAYTRHLATGDFNGQLQLWDTHRPELPVSAVKAHETIINMIDGCGGVARPGGAHELGTCSRDGSVKVWDTRQISESVFTVRPQNEASRHDAWSIAFGNFSNGSERLIAVGHDNGDLRLFDLAAGKYVWKTNVGAGICSIDFTSERQAVISTLKGVSVIQLTGDGSVVPIPINVETTMWATRHLPQDTNVFAVTAGDGQVRLWKHNDLKSPLLSASVSKHPIISCDWNREKEGLFACCSFDQTVRISLAQEL